MNKQDRVDIFVDTMEKSKDFKIPVSTKHSVKVITKSRGRKSGRILIEGHDTVSSAVKWHNKGTTCILNMASASKPGGGVAEGAQAQEECLFRCSNLWESITKGFYPINKYEAIYTKSATFFKDVKYDIMKAIKVDVVTVAAVNLNRDSYFDEEKNDWVDQLNRKPLGYRRLTKKKIRLMLSLAVHNNVDNLILGAWGCGVFKNKPEDIAKMFKDVLKEYKGSFENVIFAVINDKNSNGNNYETFKEILG
jgi:uncharacterized protein (TIGR02452 family)